MLALRTETRVELPQR